MNVIPKHFLVVNSHTGTVGGASWAMALHHQTRLVAAAITKGQTDKIPWAVAVLSAGV